MVKNIIKLGILFLFILVVITFAGDFEVQQFTSIVNPHTGTGDIIRSTNQTGVGWIFDNMTGTHIGNSSIWSESGDSVILTNISKNVGIGTSTPGSKLEVVGKANITKGVITPNITSSIDNTVLSWNSTMNTTTNVLSFTWIIKSGRVD